ncbi:DegT/DnrJ/EryC1/StrS family aminotransferase [Streptomyces sp. ODS28]|uniref:DegT/DnrJ/EryC1/StrS family aminotransferase n=1 Tax=Streptomyces sp. ODS28 TaxID=3136688 RepID=UPI0031F054A0
MGSTRLTAAGVRAGDDVVLPSFGGEEAAEAVRGVGARPVFADIDPLSLCLDPKSAEAAVTPRTSAIAPVHLFGHPADMVCLLEAGQRLGLPVVEFGGPDVGSRVTAVDAVRRRQHAAYLDRRLRGVEIPHVAQGVEHAYTDYVVRVPGNGRPDRDAFKQALRGRGVRCHVPVKNPAHRLPQFQVDLWLPETERAVAETLALPLWAGMTKRDLHRMVSACNALGGLLSEPA